MELTCPAALAAYPAARAVMSGVTHQTEEGEARPKQQHAGRQRWQVSSCHLDHKWLTVFTGYVQSGGSYLGLCAGAYYASSQVEFEPGSTLEVVGDRELDFFPGTARGAAYPGVAPPSMDNRYT